MARAARGRRITKSVWVAAVAVWAVAATVVPAHAAPGVAAPPPSVPSIQTWSAGGATFRLGADARIVAASAAQQTAQVLADDLARVGSAALPVTVGAQPRAGDIALGLDESAPEQPESYRISVDDHLSVTSRTPEGLAHGTRTVWQWLRQTPVLPGGVAEDWPRFAERGLMVDTARQFFPVDWLRQRIRDAAYLRMNYVQLHLSDNEGFRLRSDVHPEIRSQQAYSKQDIRELVAYADSYGIEIIPEIDAPGHMETVLAAHPELVLRPARTSPADAVKDQQISGSAESRIDLTNPAAYQLMGEILEEFLPLFPGQYWHIGGDEYVSDFDRYPQLADYAVRTFGPGATPGDTVTAYANWATEIVAAHGKTARVWNDGFNHPGVLTLDSSVVVQYWSAGGGGLPWFGPARPPGDFTRDGHPIVNAAFTPTYYVTGGPLAPVNAPPALLYAWDPGLFIGGSRLPEADHHLLRGSMVYLWCDDPTAMTPEQITGPLRDRMSVMAQKLWSGTDAMDYPEFLDRTHAVGYP